MPEKPKISYCSWSEFKAQEWEVAGKLDFCSEVKFEDVVEFEFRKVATHEPLLCNLEKMVRAKAISAYEAVRVPCVVEHAGLILRGYEQQSYPGGLTQPMWDALGATKFVATCGVLGREAIARAVIGYCDGASVKTFVGETPGSLRTDPAGSRDFYWDTVFCPEEQSGKTYAEIADEDIGRKVAISQSIKAMRKFLEFRRCSDPLLFPGM